MIPRWNILKRALSSSPSSCARVPQTESNIVRMFRVPQLEDGSSQVCRTPRSSRADSSAHTLDRRFLRILKIFKWGPDAERALEVLMLRVDHRLVREVLRTDVEINVKIQFFKWAGKRKDFNHDCTTYMDLIRCLEEAGLVGEMWKTIQDMVYSPCIISSYELSEVIRVLGKTKMVNKALLIFYQIKNRKCRPYASTYNSMIIMLMQEGHHDKGNELYNEMCNEGNCLPDTLTYTALIAAFGKMGHEDSAIRLFEEMKENGLQPTAKIYTKS